MATTSCSPWRSSNGQLVPKSIGLIPFSTVKSGILLFLCGNQDVCNMRLLGALELLYKSLASSHSEPLEGQVLDPHSICRVGVFGLRG
jgi:hypothetical protein